MAASINYEATTYGELTAHEEVDDLPHLPPDIITCPMWECAMLWNTLDWKGEENKKKYIIETVKRRHEKLYGEEGFEVPCELVRELSRPIPKIRGAQSQISRDRLDRR